MATVNQLNRRVNQLEQNIAAIQRDADQRQSRLQDEYNLRLNNLKRELDRAMTQRSSNQIRDIQARMDRVRRELAEETRKNYDRLQRELSAQVQQNYQNLWREIGQVKEELETAVDTEIRSVMAARDEEKIRLAEKEYRAAAGQYEAVSKRPHAFFFPGSLSIYHASLDQSRLMREQGQYEASAATSIMVAARLEVFGKDIDEKLREWLRCFDSLKEEYQKVSKKLEQVLRASEDVSEPPLSEETVAGWTSHRYDEVFSILNQSGHLIERVQRRAQILGITGVTLVAAESYLLCGGQEKARDIEEYTRALKYEIGDRLEQMKKEVHSAYRRLRQRREWVPKLKAYMQKKHNVGEPVPDDVVSAEETSLAPYCVTFTQPQGYGRAHHYTCHIVPVVTDSETENHVRIYMDFRQGSKSFQTTQNHRMIREIMEALGVKELKISVGSEKEVLDGSLDTAYSLQPSERRGGGMQLIRHDRQAVGTAGAQKGGKKDSRTADRAGTAQRQPAGRQRQRQTVRNHG